MRLLKSFFAGMVLVLVTTGLTFAQVQQQMPDVPSPDEISDEELELFLQASDAIHPIQQQAQQEIQEVIQDEGMEPERWQQIMMAQQNPQLAGQVEITAEEEEAMERMQPKIMEIEIEATEEIQDEIVNQGIEVERYQAIFMSLQQHPELMERIEELMEDNGEG